MGPFFDFLEYFKEQTKLTHPCLVCILRPLALNCSLDKCPIRKEFVVKHGGLMRKISRKMLLSEMNEKRKKG